MHTLCPGNIVDLVNPFPDAEFLDITEEMVANRYTARQIY